MAVALGCYEKSESPAAQIQYEMGNAIELAIANGLKQRFALDDPDRYVHGLELELDGITGNLDLLDVKDFAVEDVKLTKKSLRHDIDSDKFWYNWAQVKSYCCMIGSNIGRLHLVYVMGNYKFDPNDPLSGWQYRLWEDRWTKSELDAWWRIMVGHKRT